MSYKDKKINYPPSSYGTMSLNMITQLVIIITELVLTSTQDFMAKLPIKSPAMLI